MSLFSEVKKNLIYFIRQNKITLIAFILFPMIMALIYGVMEENVFSGKSSFEPIKVDFQYDKTSEEGKALTAMLNTQEVENFINSSAKDNFKCKVIIDKSFSDIKIEKINGTDSVVDMVQGFMGTFSEGINQYKILSKNIDAVSSSPEEKQLLTNKLFKKLQEIQKTSVTKDQIVEGYKTLGSREYYTISMFSLSCLMMIITLAKSFYKDKRMGLIRRTFSTPNRSTNYLIGYLSSSFILTFLVNCVYVIINRSLGIAFLTSIGGLFILIIIQSLLQAAVVGMIIAFIKSEKVCNAIMPVLVVLPMMFGGVFYTPDITGSNVLKIAANLSPNSLILNSYKNMATIQGYGGVANQMIIMVVAALVLIALSLIKVKVQWEE